METSNNFVIILSKIIFSFILFNLSVLAILAFGPMLDALFQVKFLFGIGVILFILGINQISILWGKQLLKYNLKNGVILLVLGACISIFTIF